MNFRPQKNKININRVSVFKVKTRSVRLIIVSNQVQCLLIELKAKNYKKV